MINVDGVIVGSYRTSLAGVDLNRQFNDPDPNMHPEVDCIKKLINHLQQEEEFEIALYLDLHGHSRNKNVFFYGP